MSVFHAICTGCGMSVHFERTREDVYACPYCGRSFSYAELSASCSLVNVEEAFFFKARLQKRRIAV